MKIPFFLLFIIFITTSFSASASQKNVALYQNCSSIFSCGEKFPEILYPFWGGSRSSECGEAGLRLTCVQQDYLTVDITGRKYRVLDMNDSNNAVTIAPDSLWRDGCPDDFTTTAIHPFVVFPSDTVPLQLCHEPPGTENPNTRYSLSCDNTESIYSLEETESCQQSRAITVHALGREVEEFKKSNTSTNLKGLLYKGFNVEYPLNWTACLSCRFSEGLCWPGTNSVDHTCLCPDGSRDSSLCPASSHAGVLIKLGIALGGATACAFILIACWGLYRMSSLVFIFRTKTKEDRDLEAILTQNGASLAPERYRYSVIKKMTSSFKDKIGQGGYGIVYKGKFSDGRIVAVKILNAARQNSEEFINEVMSTSRTSHVNIVRLLGFCMEGKRRALVYEYMSNGSLEKYIFCKKNEANFNQLEMDELYQISLGVARGLEYLHRGCNTWIMHFDIKPHNILLDEHFRPKISDFGMAKHCKMNESLVSILGARGTIGYIAPELVSKAFGVVSYKSDVYSYGMMILEIVGRRKNVSLETSHASEVYFPHWAYQHLVIDNDLRLKDVSPEEDEIARKIILVGLWCVQNDSSLRPTMSKAIEMLESDLQTIPMPPKSFFGFPSTPLQTSSTNSTNTPSPQRVYA